MAIDPQKFLGRFVEESRDHCGRITAGLLALEQNPSDAETLHALFRAAHTIKGSARMLKQISISGLAHHMEDVLDAVRSDRLSMSPALSDALLKGVDALMAMMDALASGGTPEAPEAVCKELAGWLEAKADEVSGAEAQPAAPPPAATEAPPSPRESPNPGITVPKVQTDYLRIDATKLDGIIQLMGEIVSEHSRLRQQVQYLRGAERSLQRLSKSLDAWSVRHGVSESAQRELKTNLREQLQTLRSPVRGIHDSTNLQEHLVGDLQEASLRMRMQPLSTIFELLRRTVRDLAREHGKDVEFVVEGEETELDRKIIEKLGDPLVHMLRNSIDHGLESPEERSAAGKTPKGTIALSAACEGGFVTISIRDDGRGLSTARIKEKALAKRLCDPESLAAMSRSEVHNLIFLPGLSTSAIITDLSGRGVGMDVVRKNVTDELRGTISIDSREGQGATFHLRLPMNLAVFPLFMVRVQGRICALPASAIQEMLSVPRSEVVEVVGKKAIRLREQLVPVDDLGALLGLPAEASTKDALIVVVVDGEERLGLIVQEILGREERVVKPHPAPMGGVRVVSGATLGEGDTIINVLRVPELVRLAKDAARSGRHAEQPAALQRAARILVVDDSVNTREIERSILEAHGYQVITAGDGEEAFDATRSETFDLIVTDIEMPRLDGFALTRRLRQDERYHSIPIVMVTSLEREEDKRKGVAAGADAYIVKSAFDQSNLLEIIRGLIG